jgi:hypothetical protein
VEIVAVSRVVGPSVIVDINACDPEGLVIDVEETTEAVRLRATVDRYSKEEDCGRTATIELEAELGSRVVIDAGTGDVVPVL